MRESRLNQVLRLPAVEAAPRLLGWILCRRLPGSIVKAKIVETEAYHQDDPASHSFRGVTKRTAPMFEAGGRLYVYFTYGMHYCLNIVVGRKGAGEAVLIRAAEPIEGVNIMRGNRSVDNLKDLLSGPAKLAQGFGIFDTSLSGKILNKSSIFLETPGNPISSINIIAAPRVGIRRAAHQPWRFYLKNNPFVSKK